jgi:hypothetical protein
MDIPPSIITKRFPRVFVSHDSKRKPEAIRFQRLIIHHTVAPAKFAKQIPYVFLSSDAHSIPSGESWFHCIRENLQKCKNFCALIVERTDFDGRWIPFEVGIALGREIAAPVFVFGQIELEWALAPLSELHLVGTGDTDRIWNELTKMGVNENQDSKDDFAHLFRQCECYRTPGARCPAKNVM